MVKAGQVLLLSLLLLGLYIGWQYIQSQHKGPQQTFEAIYVGSVFEQELPWTIERFVYQPAIRIVYQIPTDQIPPEASYIWVNITIPDTVINKIRQIWDKVSTNNEEWFETLFPIRVVYANRIAYGQWDFKIVQTISVLERTTDNIPKKIQVKLDKPGDAWWSYILVFVPSPFTEDFEEWDWRVCIGTTTDSLDSYKGWKVYPGTSSNAKACTIYVPNDRMALNFGEVNNKWVIVYKDVDIPVYADKDIPFAIGFRQGGWGWTVEKALIPIIEFETKDGKLYRLAIWIQTGDWRPNYLNNLRSVMNFQCSTPNYGKKDADWYSAVVELSLKDIIEKYCNIDWVNLTRIKRIYIAGIREETGANEVNFIWIGDPRVWVS